MFEEFENDAKAFVKEVAAGLHDPEDLQTAMRILTAVLHTIRDILSVEESLHLISQLPLYIKGIYVTGWYLGDKGRIKDKDEFIERLLLENTKTAVRDFGNDGKAIENVKAVTNVLRNHLTKGQVNHIADQLPGALKDLWQTEDAVRMKEVRSQEQEARRVR